MQYWIMIDGQRLGPLDLEGLDARGDVTPDTPIWYQSLGDWTVAANVPDVNARLFASATPPPAGGAQGGTQPPQNPNWQQPQQQGWQPQNQGGRPPMPPNYLAWAIVITLCCCLPGGIVAIIYSSQVQSAYLAGDYDRALNSSRNAKTWIIISVIAGIVAGIIYTILYFTAGITALSGYWLGL